METGEAFPGELLAQGEAFPGELCQQCSQACSKEVGLSWESSCLAWAYRTSLHNKAFCAC